MNEVLAEFAVEHLSKNGRRCTKEDLFSAMKEHFKDQNLNDEELESELVKSLKITGTVENGIEYYSLKPSDGKAVGLPPRWNQN